MMKNWRFMLISFVCMSSVGCASFVPFTHKHGTDLESRLQNVQFYISHPIVLTRDMTSVEEQIADAYHRIYVRNKRKIMEITIPRHTPGVLHKIEGDEMDKLHIQFELSSDEKERTIPFAKIARDRVETNADGQVYQFNEEEIIYDDETYTVSFFQKDVVVSETDTPIYIDRTDQTTQNHYFTKTFYPLLMINPVEYVDTFEKEQRTVSGVEIGKQTDTGGFKSFFGNLLKRLQFWKQKN